MFCTLCVDVELQRVEFLGMLKAYQCLEPRHHEANRKAAEDVDDKDGDPARPSRKDAEAFLDAEAGEGSGSASEGNNEIGDEYRHPRTDLQWK